MEGSIEENIISRTKLASDKNRRECSTFDSDITNGNIQVAGGDNIKEVRVKLLKCESRPLILREEHKWSCLRMGC
jgi:hypothetical protein